jgi:hypothetical protein
VDADLRRPDVNLAGQACAVRQDVTMLRGAKLSTAFVHKHVDKYRANLTSH